MIFKKQLLIVFGLFIVSFSPVFAAENVSRQQFVSSSNINNKGLSRSGVDDNRRVQSKKLPAQLTTSTHFSSSSKKLERIKSATSAIEYNKRIEKESQGVKKGLSFERKEKIQKELLKIKDDKKRAIVERINKRINDLNQNRTKHLALVLSKIETTLSKIKNFVNNIEMKGRDVSSIKNSITEVEKALVVSRQTIQAQASKIYEVVVTTENNLRGDVGKTRQALRDDLIKTQETVRDVREKMRQVFNNLNSFKDINSDNLNFNTEVTSSLATSTQ
jgi:hypothetical protein